MASINYETIFNLFLGSITDIKIASLEKEDADVLMAEYLHKAISSAYLGSIFTSCSLDDNSKIFTYGLKYATAKDDSDFIANAIAKWMVYEWLHNQVRSTVNTMQFFGGSEQKFFSQKGHSEELRALQNDAYKEARDFVMDRGWINNSYLGGS